MLSFKKIYRMTDSGEIAGLTLRRRRRGKREKLSGTKDRIQTKLQRVIGSPYDSGYRQRRAGAPNPPENHEIAAYPRSVIRSHP
jgi:hypothetical protein